MKVLFKPKYLTLAKQAFSLQQVYPDGIFLKKTLTGFIWRIFIKPDSICREYHIVVEYRYPMTVHVFLVEAEELRDGKIKAPHVYGDYDTIKDRIELCLYYGKEFQGIDSMTRTIIPWTMEWLLHYECWRVTGEWHGGGIH